MRDIDEMDIAFFLRALRSGDSQGKGTGKGEVPSAGYIDELGIF